MALYLHRKRHGESRAYAGRAIYFNFSPVLADDSEGAGQPKPGAFAFGFGSEERLENCGLNLDRDTDTGVGDRYLHNLLFFVSD